MEIPQRKGEPVVFSKDEAVRDHGGVAGQAAPRLHPGRSPPGTSSQISEAGAAAIEVVMSEAKAQELGLQSMAIGAHGNVAGPDNSLQSQPSNAILHALEEGGLDVSGSRPDRDRRGVRHGGRGRQ